MNTISLLLVDDKPENLIALEAVLKDSEYHLLMASSGPEAIKRVQKEHVDLILLDVQMPGMDGFETAKQIKQLPQDGEIPIIFISAVYVEDPFIKKGYAAGAIDYFSKPFDPEILKLKVQLYSSFRQKKRLLVERELRVKESEELLKAGRKLATILESLPVGVIIADSKGRICQTNEELQKIWKAEGILAADDYGVYLGWWDKDGSHIRSEQSPLYRALNEGQLSHNELLEIKCLDGSLKTVLCSTSPLRGLDAKIVGAVVVIQDITEHKRIEEDLERRIGRLVSTSYELEQVFQRH